MGGCRENASTIHSAHHKRQKATHEALLRVKYSERIEILVVDEVFNCDDYTLEMVLSLALNASRVVLIGDPDQIMPIPGEEGAGTPAIDIAKAFPQHVITLNENMRQQASALAIHDVVTNVRIKQPRAICWNSPSGAVHRIDPPARETVESMTAVLGPMITRLRQGIKWDEHAWQLITFYNGFKPEQQGLGVKQLNEIVDKWIDMHEPGRKRGGCKINNRLFMWPGFKFIINAPFKPHKSLRPAGLNKRKPAAQAAIRKKMAAGDGDTVYSETRNGQIEVVKSIKMIKIKGSAADSWVVECQPKGQCVRGAKLLINRRLHVDPSSIEPAWAITSNKSMGGECKNVCVYVPSTIGRSYFDRSSLYVALSRPTEWLGVVGHTGDIATMVMRDPRPVLTGLSHRLRTALVTRPGAEELGWDWKDQHDYDVHDMLNEELLTKFEDIYDQSKRRIYGKPTALCALSWASFLASEEMLLKGNLAAVKALTAYVKMVQTRLYAHVEDHSPKVEAPWMKNALLDMAPVRREDDLVVDEPALVYVMPPVLVETDDDDNLIPVSYSPPVYESPGKKARRADESESL
jgi:hypothetical protein